MLGCKRYCLNRRDHPNQAGWLRCPLADLTQLIIGSRAPWPWSPRGDRQSVSAARPQRQRVLALFADFDQVMAAVPKIPASGLGT